MTATVKSWSYSRLALYEQCPLQFKLRHIDKLPEAESPALEKGKRVDKLAEDYVMGLGDDTPPPELSKFDRLFRELRAIPAEFKMVQQQWGYDANWKPSGWSEWKKTKLRVKLDAGVVYPDGVADVVDVKTGKMYDSNKEQLDLYALATFCRFPHVSHVTTRLWYLDVPGPNNEVTAEFEQHERTDMIQKWEKRVAPLFADTVFAPRPNDKCRWCSYAKSKGGPCKFG